MYGKLPRLRGDSHAHRRHGLADGRGLDAARRPRRAADRQHRAAFRPVAADRHDPARDGTTLPLLQVLDLPACSFNYLQSKLAPDIIAAPEALTKLVPAGTDLVVTGLDRASDIRWAVSHGIALGRGRALAR